MPRKKLKPKIVERKLGREVAWGIATTFGDGRKQSMVEVDTRLSPRRQLEVFIHEATHIALPSLTDTGSKAGDKKGEREVDRIGKVIADILWRANYRKVVLENKHSTPVRITTKPKRKR